MSLDALKNSGGLVTVLQHFQEFTPTLESKSLKELEQVKIQLIMDLAERKNELAYLQNQQSAPFRFDVLRKDIEKQLTTSFQKIFKIISHAGDELPVQEKATAVAFYFESLKQLDNAFDVNASEALVQLQAPPEEWEKPLQKSRTGMRGKLKHVLAGLMHDQKVAEKSSLPAPSSIISMPSTGDSVSPHVMNSERSTPVSPVIIPPAPRFPENLMPEEERKKPMLNVILNNETQEDIEKIAEEEKITRMMPTLKLLAVKKPWQQELKEVSQTVKSSTKETWAKVMGVMGGLKLGFQNKKNSAAVSYQLWKENMRQEKWVKDFQEFRQRTAAKIPSPRETWDGLREHRRGFAQVFGFALLLGVGALTAARLQNKYGPIAMMTPIASASAPSSDSQALENASGSESAPVGSVAVLIEQADKPTQADQQDQPEQTATADKPDTQSAPTGLRQLSDKPVQVDRGDGPAPANNAGKPNTRSTPAGLRQLSEEEIERLPDPKLRNLLKGEIQIEHGKRGTFDQLVDPMRKFASSSDQKKAFNEFINALNIGSYTYCGELFGDPVARTRNLTFKKNPTKDPQINAYNANISRNYELFSAAKRKLGKDPSKWYAYPNAKSHSKEHQLFHQAMDEMTKTTGVKNPNWIPKGTKLPTRNLKLVEEMLHTFGLTLEKVEPDKTLSQ